ncbi:MAG: hypothetical protein FWC47_10100 [Oscillospiraceae bacterium]|nr:hypothetical protein [Oscillospiraceae bacterium]
MWSNEFAQKLHKYYSKAYDLFVAFLGGKAKDESPSPKVNLKEEIASELSTDDKKKYLAEELNILSSLYTLNLMLIDNDYIKSQTLSKEESIEYYEMYLKVSDEIGLLSKIVCNNLDVPNENALLKANDIFETENVPLFVTGNGGQGKTSLMFRFAVQKAREGFHVFWIRLNANSVIENEVNEMITRLESISKKTGLRVLLFIDNPFVNEQALWMIHDRIGSNYDCIQVILFERLNRLKTLIYENENKLEFWYSSANVICLLNQKNVDEDFWYNKESCYMLPPNKGWKRQIISKLERTLVSSGKYNAQILAKVIASEVKEIENENIAIVENIFIILLSYRDVSCKLEKTEAVSTSGIKMDWDEWHEIVKTKLNCSFEFSYAYIACLYLFKISTTTELLSALMNIPVHTLNDFFEAKFKSSMGEPLHYHDGKIWPKHDMIADIFFRFNKEPSVQTCLERLMPLMDEEMLLSLSNLLFTREQILNCINPKWKDYYHLKYDRLAELYIKCVKQIGVDAQKWRPHWLLLVGFMYYNTIGDEHKAKDSIDQAFQLYPDESDVRYNYALYYIRNNDMEKSEPILLEIVSKGGYDSKEQLKTVMNVLFSYYFNHGDKLKIYRIINEIIDNEPAKVQLMCIFEVLSQKLFSSIYLNAASLFLEKAKNCYPNSSTINKLRLELNIKNQNPEASLKSLQILVDSHKVRKNEIYFLFDKRKLSDTRTLFDQFAYLCMKLNKRELSFDIAKDLVLNHSSKYSCLLISLRIFLTMEEFDSAFQVILKLEENQLERIPFYFFECGDLFLKKGKYEYANHCFSYCSSKKQENTFILNSIGLSYMKAKNYEKAEEYFNMSLSMWPNDTYALIWSIQAAINGNLVTPNIKARANRTCELYQDSIPILGKLALLYIKLKEPKLAESCYLRILELNPNDDRAICGLFNIYFYSHQVEKAKEILESHSNVNNIYIRNCRIKAKLPLIPKVTKIDYVKSERTN